MSDRNRITISRGGDVPPQRVTANGHEVDRSFAQPNPEIQQEEIQPRAHASEDAEKAALEKNSKKGRRYKNGKAPETDSDA
jgi:hypothetical protein